MGNTSTKFHKKTTAIEAADNIDLNGKVVLVTGCNCGIGKETVRVLAIRGAKVYMLCRNLDKANTARDEIIASITPAQNKTFDAENITTMQLDLSSLLSIRRFAAKYMALNQPIDYLINNAGIMAIPQFQASADGYEMTFAVNHLGHFYLTVLLTPVLVTSAPCRVIVLASSAHTGAPKLDDATNNFIVNGLNKKEGPVYVNDTLPMKGYENYGLSKACNILFAREYNRRYGGDGVVAVSVHPGVVYTQLYRYSGSVTQMFASITSVFQKSIEQGAATTVRCVSLSDDEICGGYYYKDCNAANDTLRSDIKIKIKAKVEVKKVEKKTDEKVKEEEEKEKEDKGKEEVKKSDEKSEDKLVEKSEEKAKDKTEEISEDKVEDKPVEKTDEVVEDKIEDKIEDKDKEKDKGVEKEKDKGVEKEKEKTEEKPVEDIVKENVEENKEEKKEDNVEQEEKVEEKEDVNSLEYKLWEWSEILITSKGFNLDMIGFEEEEKERVEKERLEKERLETEARLAKEAKEAKEEQDRVEKEKAEKEAKEAKEAKDAKDVKAKDAKDVKDVKASAEDVKEEEEIAKEEAVSAEENVAITDEMDDDKKSNEKIDETEKEKAVEKEENVAITDDVDDTVSDQIKQQTQDVQ